MHGLTNHHGSFEDFYSYFHTDEDPELGSNRNRLSSTLDEELEPVTLTWKDVNVYALPKKGGCCQRGKAQPTPKQILTNVNGMIKPGKLMAVMGASGAGKSTLLNVLTYRNRGNLILQGDVRVNGVIVDKTKIANISAYVQQDDLFIGTLTVREHLTFRALLRMDKRKTKAERLKKVEDVILELGLTKCADTVIGLPGRLKGISGGEMKRLSFASELLTNPPLMFCDEATSGLDSFMAFSVIQALKTMTKSGRTILCTIHQPPSEVFELFDELFLLAEGRVAFSGPMPDALEFFKTNGYPCPVNYNPADHYILTLAVIPGKETDCKARVQKICDKFEASEACKTMKEEMNGMCDHRQVSQKFILNTLSDTTRYGASFIQQLRSVFWRSWITSIRDPLIVRIKFIQTIFFALILGIIYLKTDDDYAQDDIMNINGVIFVIITNLSFNNIFSVLNVFPIEVPIFLREYGTGLYGVGVYYMSKTLVEIPFLIVIPVIFMSILYWMSGLIHDGYAFLVATGVAIVISNTAASFGYVVSAAAPTVTAALAIAPALMIPFLLFGGFFLNSGSIPDWLIWFKYLSWFSYGNEMLVVNQWDDVNNIACTSNSTCIPRGELVIKSLSFDKDNFYLDLGLLFALFIGFRLISFIVLLIRAKRSSS
ncbi:protein white-like isoform X1 [Saccostrea echinata]|uniref:protein white-like isoform X1 n=1 Tax=Saccostrea echinata TaxID=191078 RepID=UPI002A80657C|nr:protein white-like isoform X1 [Saccostrea echinata]